MNCDDYHPDKVFERFEVIEFPLSYLGLSSSKELDVGLDLNKSAYLKTMCKGQLLKFDVAREVSGPHRAFHINLKDEHTIYITFTPKIECIFKAKHETKTDNKFVFDLHLIKTDGTRCCYNEFHSEVGRYYITGEFEYSKIFHTPEIIDFEDVETCTKAIKHLCIRNESNRLGAKLQYIKVTGIEVLPQNFNIPANSSRNIIVTIKPTSLNLQDAIYFKIFNPHNQISEIDTKNSENTSLLHEVKFKINVVYTRINKNIQVESIHKLIDFDPRYMYNNKELAEKTKRKALALTQLDISKSLHLKKPKLDRIVTRKEKCNSDVPIKTNRSAKEFCKTVKQSMTIYDIFNVQFKPLILNFGRVAHLSHGETVLTIENNTKFDIHVELLKDLCIFYNEKNPSNFTLKIKPFAKVFVTLYCCGHIEGLHKKTFKYIIDQKFYREHYYTLCVGNPTLMITDKCLKFGMVSTEMFAVSVPLRIQNNFNIAINFEFEELQPDIPFKIIPNKGTVFQHSVKICDISYVCKATKTKIHGINLKSLGTNTKVIPVELSIMTRKLSIKFTQPVVTFKDVPLNLETIEKVKLENSSKEIALFHVIEPLIPGFRIEPMCGIIKPKMIVTFKIIAKIACVLEFAFDILVKINNKENVTLPVIGNVIEPRIIIQPKNIYMSRIPCNMITYVPVILQNVSSVKTVVEVLDTGDENMFSVYISQGNEKERVFEFTIAGGEFRTVFIKVYDVFRREYEMYIPFKINYLLGPPDLSSNSTELQYYTGSYEKLYETNLKLKLKTVNKDIGFCRITGVITVPWILFSQENFEIDYIPNDKNTIEFTMTNISKYILTITVLTTKLSPNFTLNHHTEENLSIINESQIKCELDCGKKIAFSLIFHPKGHGRFVATAIMYLDKSMTVPYHNLTFVGKKETPLIYPSTYRIIFPPCYVGYEISRIIEFKMEIESNLESFSCYSKEEENLSVDMFEANIFYENETAYTITRVKITACCKFTYSCNITLNFYHNCGSSCDVDVNFCFTYCPITLHTLQFVTPEDSPYPYYPLCTQLDFYKYMEACVKFLEKWMFLQGFRRDLYPKIPDTFDAISNLLSSQPENIKSKGINVSYLNFVKRLAGPLMKHIRKINVVDVDDNLKWIMEIHDTYREIIFLLKARGANVWSLRARFLLSYDQFVFFSKNHTSRSKSGKRMTQQLLADTELFHRLNKQSWVDLILQSYKVFILDSCFFDCICISSQPRDIIGIIIEWYNENILLVHRKLRGENKNVKTITNLTTDLSDGIAIISTILNFCPFLEEQLLSICEVDSNYYEESIIHNACLIIEAIGTLRLHFPLKSKDFFQPNFLQMLFFSIHLYVTLPMFKPKSTVDLSPPLLRSSSRQVAISSSSQETLIFNYTILNNNKNSFSVEKASSAGNGKKIYLNVKYLANFVADETSILLVHGYNKTRVFDTYIMFLLKGHVGSLSPLRKCKVVGPLYRPNKVDVFVSSPFTVAGTYKLHLTDCEPSIPVKFEDDTLPRFYVRRLNLMDKEVNLSAIPKENMQDVPDHKLYLQIICLSCQIGNSWIWFRGECGDFFIRVTTQPRWDLAIDTLQAKVHSWPMDPCSCGESCECYRTTVITIPHRNELMLKSLRYALLEQASEVMMQVYDSLIDSTTGKIILTMLLQEGGTNLSEVQHILCSDVTYRITSRGLIPRKDLVTLAHHSGQTLSLPITISHQDILDKYTLVFTSECGMDIRTYRILFIDSFSEL